MARIAGIDLPKNKRIEIGLTYIYGVGKSTSASILERLNINKDIRVKDIPDEQIDAIRKVISDEYTVEGTLRSQIKLDIKRLMDLGNYRGMRHRKGLPVNGQRTKTNARTRKGKKKVSIKKK